MFSFRKNAKRGFTLIEMLIVIVIIGILAAALIPRLTSVRGRANDAARKADIQQIASALVAYQIDHGSFPATAGNVSLINNDLVSAGMSSVPTDPNKSRNFAGIAGGVTSGEYGYTPIKKSGIDANGFVLMAGVETEGGANRVATDGGTNGIADIDSTDDYTTLVPCYKITPDDNTDANNSGDCTYVKGTDVLRYIYIY